MASSGRRKMAKNQFKPELDRIVPEWSGVVSAAVAACFTCRSGGVSSGPYGTLEGIMGLNLADHVGDAAACVRMNRSILTQCLPAEPKWLRQVHGTTIVNAAELAAGVVPEADASFTTRPGVVLCVMTADCLPVLIAEKRGRAVAAVHAGWRSLAAGIVQKTVERLRAELNDPAAEFAVWFGPRIGAEDFAVGDDVLEAMRETIPSADAHFCENTKGAHEGKWLADLGGLAPTSSTARFRPMRTPRAFGASAATGSVRAATRRSSGSTRPKRPDGRAASRHLPREQFRCGGRH